MSTNSTCLRCGKDFGRRCDLNRHLNGKRKCSSTYLDISNQQMMSNYQYYFELFKKSNVKQSSTPLTTDQIQCEKCDKQFNHKCNYYTHKRLYCPVIKKELEEEKQKKEVENKIKEMLEAKIQDKIEEKLENKIDKILDEKLEGILGVKIQDKLEEILDNKLEEKITNILKKKLS